MENSGSYSERPNGVPDLGRLLRTLETKDQALKAAELAKLLRVTRQHIYKMAAEGSIPSFRVGCAIRFDPGQIADWLRRRMPTGAVIRKEEIVISRAS
jgi:excisionase family DNA binding protein